MLAFENPFAFLILFLPLLILFFRKIRILKKFSAPAVLCDWGETPPKFFSTNFFSRFSKILFALGFFFLVFAMTNPVLIQREKSFLTRNSEILFLLDSSPSMSAKDFENFSRFENAKNAIKKLVQKNNAANFSLAALATETFLLVPATNDKDFFLSRLEDLQVGTFGNETALGIALGFALCHLSSSLAPKKSCVLITDGENNSDIIHPETCAELLKKNKIDLYVIGIGKSGQNEIEFFDKDSGQMKIGFYESNFDSDFLSSIAKSGGGKYFEASAIENLEKIFESICEDENFSRPYFFQNHKKNVAQYFSILSLCFFVLAEIFKRIFCGEIL